MAKHSPARQSLCENLLDKEVLTQPGRAGDRSENDLSAGGAALSSYGALPFAAHSGEEDGLALHDRHIR